jgi:hypothetical protein
MSTICYWKGSASAVKACSRDTLAGEFGGADRTRTWRHGAPRTDGKLLIGWCYTSYWPSECGTPGSDNKKIY